MVFIDELILRPKPDRTYKLSAIESGIVASDARIAAGNRLAALADDQIEYLVEDIVLYLAVVDNYERVPDKMTYVLDLEETEMLPRSMAAAANTVTENFTCSKSTFGLSVAVQGITGGNSTLVSPTKFIISDGAVNPANSTENLITSLRVDYGGQSRPVPSATPNFVAGIDYQTYRYAENAIENLSAWDTGGALDKSTWRTLGPLYHFQWRRSGDDISTNVDVEITHGDFDSAANLLLFHHFRRVIEFTVESGQVTQFLAQDA